MKKKIVLIFLAVLMVVSALPITASAAGKEVFDHYSKNGKYAVSTLTYKVKGNDFTYKVWYPKNIKKLSKRPVLLYCNGTGSDYEKNNGTSEFLSIAASHGYVCLCNTDQNTGLGTSMDAGFTKLMKINKKKGSKIYNKLDLKKVVLAGHSQGATCTISMSDPEKYENAKYYKAIFMASLPSQALENSPIQNCPYDPDTVKLPTLLVGGTGGTDANIIAPFESSLFPAFQAIKRNTDIYLARMKGVEHADSCEKTFPYMIAWFDYQLYGKELAGKAFKGKRAELKTNPEWTDFYVKVRSKSFKIKKAKALNKAIKVSWKKDKKASGYEIKYATNEYFENKKTVKIANPAKASATIKKLKSGKTYYIRVRSYTKVGKKKFVSKWSKLKTVEL